MKELNPSDLKIEVGIRAYEEWFNENISDKSLSPIREKYSAAVFIRHMPTNLCAYSNKYKSQVKNRDIALSVIKEMMNKGYIDRV